MKDIPDLRLRDSGVDGLMVFTDVPNMEELGYLAKVIAMLPGVRQVHNLRYVKPEVIDASRREPPLA